MVGLAAIPSAALWGALSSRYSHPVLLTAALLLQAAGIALACTASGAAALLGALLFGGTFIGVSTLALAAGRLLQHPSTVALLTAGYSAGQIVGRWQCRHCWATGSSWRWLSVRSLSYSPHWRRS